MMDLESVLRKLRTRLQTSSYPIGCWLPRITQNGAFGYYPPVFGFGHFSNLIAGTWILVGSGTASERQTRLR